MSKPSKPTRVDVHLIKLRVDAGKGDPIYRIIALAMPGSHVMGFEDLRGSEALAEENARATGAVFQSMTGLSYRLVHGGSDWMLGDGSSTLDAASSGGRCVPKTFPAYYTRVVKLLPHDPTAADARMAKIGFRARIAPESVAAASVVRARASGLSAGRETRTSGRRASGRRKRGFAFGGGGVVENTITILAVQKGVEFEVRLRRQHAGAYEVIRKFDGAIQKWAHVGTIDAQGGIHGEHLDADEQKLLRSMRRVLVERGVISL